MALADYQQFVKDEQASSAFSTWKKQNPKEYAGWVTFNTAILAATTSSVPPYAPVTKYAKALVDAANLYLETLPAAVEGPAAPAGPFTNYTAQQWYRDVANPTTISKLHIDTSDAYGFGIQGYFDNGNRPAPSPGPFTISDIWARSTASFNPQGTSGFGAWFGTQGNISRVYGEGPNGGVWFGCNSLGTVAEDIVGIGNSGDPGAVGAYFEHICANLTVRRAQFNGGPSAQRSVQIEWTYGGEGSYDIIFDEVDFYCPAGGYGIQLGPGTYGCQILPSCTFSGPGKNILAPKNLADPTKPNVFGPAFSVDWDDDPIG